jgi:putative endonuclease
MITRRKRIGVRGEKIAAECLARKGYTIIGQNVRVGRKEIDLICRDGADIVFVEVKTGRSSAFGDPAFRVDRRKRQAIAQAAQRWISEHPDDRVGYRFDVITVDTDFVPPRVEHREAAFSLEDT